MGQGIAKTYCFKNECTSPCFLSIANNRMRLYKHDIVSQWAAMERSMQETLFQVLDKSFEGETVVVSQVLIGALALMCCMS
jgi:hypothetical protein